MKIKKIFQSIFKNAGIFIFKLIYGKVKVGNKSDSDSKYLKKEINFDVCKNIYNFLQLIMLDFILTEYKIQQL